jgi:branched-subunit amino acid aminotransferase/4-amino-4-deoxychorismate lyase
VLPGITRAIVLELTRTLGLRCREGAITREHLRAAPEVLLTNSVQEVLPLSVLDGRELPSREIGERLRAAYRERVATDA